MLLLITYCWHYCTQTRRVWSGSKGWKTFGGWGTVKSWWCKKEQTTSEDPVMDEEAWLHFHWTDSVPGISTILCTLDRLEGTGQKFGFKKTVSRNRLVSNGFFFGLGLQKGAVPSSLTSFQTMYYVSWLFFYSFKAYDSGEDRVTSGLQGP